MKNLPWKALALFSAGIFIAASSASRYSHLEFFAQALHLIKEKSLSPIKAEKLVVGAVKGMILELDPYSQLLSAEDLKELEKDSSGRYFGLGLKVEREQNSLVVLSVFKNSSAEKAGFLPGDKILKIGDQTVRSMTGYDFQKIFKKEKRKTHKITVLRDSKILFLQARPRWSNIKSTELKEIQKGLFYLKIHQFSPNTILELNQSLKNKKIKSLLLDLRNNPGGVFNQAVLSADLFLKKGVIASYKIRNEKEEVFTARYSNTLPDFPMVALINEFSASASEALAGALKDHKRAVLAGRKTFGKGLLQDIFPLKNNYALKLSVGKYKTPSGKIINKRGIQPNVLIPKTKDSFKIYSDIKKDPEIAQALQILKGLTP